MNQITFEKLKQNCVTEFCADNTRGFHGELCPVKQAGAIYITNLIELKRTNKFNRSQTLVKQIEDKCVKAIEAVDVRNVRALVELCPKSIPEWIKSGNYTIDLVDKGWTFFRS